MKTVSRRQTVQGIVQHLFEGVGGLREQRGLLRIRSVRSGEKGEVK